MGDGHSATTPSALERLDSGNYPTWSFKMMIFLRTRNLWSAIETPRPEAEAQRRTWDQSNMEALNILVQTLSTSQTSFVINQTTARGVWEKLQQVNRGKVLEKKIGLKRDLNAVKWKKGETATEYMQRVEYLGEQLRSLGESLEDAELAAIAIQGLPRTYRGVARSFDICAMADVTPEKIRYALIREEQRLKEDDSTDEAAYKAGIRMTKASGTGQKGSFKCYQCGKPGHIAKNCWHAKGGGSRQNPERGIARTTTRTPRQGYHRARFAQDGNAGDITFGHEPQDFAFEVTGPYEDRTKDGWSLDSGASSHMTGCRSIITDYKEHDNRTVTLADGTTITSKGTGVVTFRTTDGSTARTLTARNVLHVPGMVDNLISVSKLTDSGLQVVFSGNVCQVFSGQQLVLSAEKADGIYSLRAEVIRPHESANGAHDDIFLLWHRRMGHVNFRTLETMSKQQAVTGIPCFENGTRKTCTRCVEGKQSRDHFKPSSTGPRRSVLDLLHIDLCGPFPVASFGGSRYLLVIVDDGSRKVTPFFLRYKDEATDAVINFINQAETQTRLRVKRIRTDNGKEFVNRRLDSYLQHLGIVHEKTTPYSPAQNGVAERMHRTLVESARTLLGEAGLPPVFWAEAVSTAAYVRNRTSSVGVSGQVPEEIFTGRKQCVSYFKAFGCVAYSWVPTHGRTKLDPRGIPVIFVGYCEDRKAYKLFDPQQSRFFFGRDIKFQENKRGSDLLKSTSEKVDATETIFYSQHPSSSSTPESPAVSTEEDRTVADDESHSLSGPSDVSVSLPSSDVDPTESSRSSTPEGVRRSTRIRNRPDRLQLDPSQKSYCKFTEETAEEPTTYAEALNSAQRELWKGAMDEELSSLQEMETWTLVPRTPEMKVVKSKWVYRIKKGPTGKIEKYKARLVAVGCTQIHGVDYFETYSPVVKLTSLRLLLALAIEDNMFMRQLDVKTAYLHGKLDEVVYMEQPAGAAVDGMVCKLNKSIYGLKQSGRTWYRTLDAVLLKQGYRRLESERCVYLLEKGNERIVLSVYVDDMLMFATTQQGLQDAMNKLGKEIQLKDLGEPRYILGIEVHRDNDNNRLTLTQRKHIDDLLKRYNMADSKPVRTPMEVAQWKSCSQATAQDQVKPDVPYQSLMGHLMYLVQGTRPDIAFAVNFLSQYNTSFSDKHWRMAKRILRYLKGTKDLGLTYAASSGKVLGYSDASLNEQGGGKSRSGYVFTLSGGAVSWRSCKQGLVALSSCEAEFVALAESMKEGKWIKAFLQELGLGKCSPSPFVLYSDSQSAIKLLENPIYHQRSKHIGLKYLYARNEVENGVFQVQFVPTDSMVADGLTKPLPHSLHTVCVAGCGLSLISPAPGGG